MTPAVTHSPAGRFRVYYREVVGTVCYLVLPGLVWVVVVLGVGKLTLFPRIRFWTRRRSSAVRPCPQRRSQRSKVACRPFTSTRCFSSLHEVASCCGPVETKVEVSALQKGTRLRAMLCTQLHTSGTCSWQHVKDWSPYVGEQSLLEEA